ncbi:MAG: hypoxanthine phosphoribosyltransferase [Clostridia bacterium]|nr:hypoxanthine phosphoribosyltransferase [Clostridia bacterium]MBP3588049.1 hypoxanthine phosphoribosyltransferase [Clostridia bacterium]
MKNDMLKTLYSKQDLEETVARLGREITKDYQGKTPVLVAVLKGAFIFMADLVRAIEIPCTVDFMVVSSYGKSTQTSGSVKIIKDLDTNIEGKDVIIVEDILDSGITLSNLIRILNQRHPASIKICTLFDKPARHKVDIQVDYNGLEVPDEFIVGYGLDYAEIYRNYPEIAVLKPEVYED